MSIYFSGVISDFHLLFSILGANASLTSIFLTIEGPHTDLSKLHDVQFLLNHTLNKLGEII